MSRVSIIIPCRNEERQIERCLDAVGRQSYPHDRIEILVADGMSTDNTRAVVDDWTRHHDVNVRIVDNPRLVAEFGNARALSEAGGDFVYLMGADEVMGQVDFIEAFVEAFVVFPDIVGVEQEFLQIPSGSTINNYLAAIHINDPLARDMARKPRPLRVVRREGRLWREWQFQAGYPAKLFLRRSCLTQFLGEETFEEGQVMLRLALDGNDRMATVDGYGVYHYNVKSLSHYLRKRWKIAGKHTTRIQERKTWVNYTGRRMYLFALLHLTVLYPLIVSVCQAVRTRRWVWLLHAPVAFCVSAVYVVGYICMKMTSRKAW